MKERTETLPAYYPIRLEQIQPPAEAMRKNIDEEKLESLAQSIKEIGLINPITVVDDGEYYKIIAGERRYLAYLHLEKSEIPAIILDSEDDTNDAITISENIHREDVPVAEEAVALLRMKEKHSLTQAQLAQLIGKTESYVSERLAILSYPDGLREALEDGKITFSVARELSRLDDPDTLRIYTETATKAGVTPRLARQWVRDWKSTSGGEQNLRPIDTSGHGGGPAAEPEMTTGCHICTQTVPLTKIRRLNVCPDCWDNVFKSMFGQE